jgi:hypothetical protein
MSSKACYYEFNIGVTAARIGGTTKKPGRTLHAEEPMVLTIYQFGLGFRF